MDNSIGFRRAGILLAYPLAYAYVRLVLNYWASEWTAVAAYTSFSLVFIIVSEIVRRGRNAHARHPVPKNQNPDDYAMSTGFEALWGFLYLTGQNERIHLLIKYINEVKPDV